MIFDTHAHYDDEDFDVDREALLSGMKAAGVSHIVNIGASLESTKRSLELSKQYQLYRQAYCGCIFSKREETGNL